jgi:hypothetical protein
LQLLERADPIEVLSTPRFFEPATSRSHAAQMPLHAPTMSTHACEGGGCVLKGKRTGRTANGARPAKATAEPSTRRETTHAGSATLMLQGLNQKSNGRRPTNALPSRYGWLWCDGLADRAHHDSGYSGYRCLLVPPAMNMPRPPRLWLFQPWAYLRRHSRPPRSREGSYRRPPQCRSTPEPRASSPKPAAISASSRRRGTALSP